MELFVPGRLCLFGEHSDWAGGYRHLNQNLGKGYTLLVGLNQGIYAQVQSHPTHLIIHSYGGESRPQNSQRLSLNPLLLREEAQAGGFFSYSAGVAYHLLNHYPVQGLEINNYYTDLPMQKGLSSSAAFCVLVVRGFNQIYNLNLTLQEEMELAYQGEITTPSRCGRMDQACAYGNQPILMTFDGETTQIQELSVPQDLFFVIVDLGVGKNTQEILGQLNQGYPFATTPIHEQVQQYLGTISASLTQEAAEALTQGNAQRIGQLMQQAQEAFDQYMMPACPSQLTAPILHQLLTYKPLQPYILGGKGVGSQGDGTAQFIVEDACCQQQVIDLIEKDFPQMHCLKLVIHRTSTQTEF